MKCFINFILGGYDAFREEISSLKLNVIKIVKCKETKTHHKIVILFYVILTVIALYGLSIMGVG